MFQALENKELTRLLASAAEPDEGVLRSQRISYAYGNLPFDEDYSRNCVEATAESIRLIAAKIRVAGL